MLAFYMGEELGRKTAFIECNKHQDMTLIQKAYTWSSQSNDSFSFHQITCYKEVKGDRIIEIFGEDYECIILDFGTDFMNNSKEFLRCSTKIVIGGRSEWDLQKLLRFQEMVSTVRQSSYWLYFIPQANGTRLTRIKKEAEGRIFAVPILDNPVLPSYEINRFFKSILEVKY
jgi:hypothetical protein